MKKMQTRILYEDDTILVCHKRAGMATQSASLVGIDVESELRNYLHGGELHVVHRLDQPVEGILVFAKNKNAASNLSTQGNDGRMQKIYHAVVCGKAEPEAAELTDYLVKQKNGFGAVVSKEEMKKNQGSGAKEARLSYRILHYNCDMDVSFLEIRLETGRFHQIRLQMCHAGFPIAGDFKYGGSRAKEAAVRLGLRYTALAACRLSFEHPRTKKRMQFEISPEFEK